MDGDQSDFFSPTQLQLLDVEPTWRKLWRGMPEYDHEDLGPWRTITVNFPASERAAFERVIGQKIIGRSIWHPKAEITRYMNKRFKTEEHVQPRYPVYVISKGRWESRWTVKALEQMNVEYKIVIEPQEFDNYAAVIDPAKILILPFSNLGQGSIPARNWIWNHAVASGAERHWILDDNITMFLRFQDNIKTPVGSGVIFRAAEDFVDRFENVAQAGFNYFMFIERKNGKKRPVTLNTRIYSCILLKNDIPYRWRGKYNEDTDLSLRILKDGWCTVLFNAFLCYKLPTMTVKGGNTDELYKGDGRKVMAESLRAQHPDVVRVARKWRRWQHVVDYRPFKDNRLILKPGAEIAEDWNNYGMELEHL